MIKPIASEKAYKTENCCNPISPNIFCADPTGVEYNGRLYIYGTNDQQQYDAVGDDGKNSYEHIKSLVIFSTNDMVNWEYHGLIKTSEVAPWIVNSWAPSITSRVEEDGLTHFYLYFSNGGCGVGVLTATNPLGPWSDPLGKPLIYQNMSGLENCPAPFDPGVCIDENDIGWLVFGGGVDARGGVIHTKTPKIVKLGSDLLSLDGQFVSIDAPYFFEAGEIDCINGNYFYSYCTDWQSREGWDRTDIKAPPIGSMAYLTTITPLDCDSWEYKGEFFLNAGDSGMDWCNNHTHIITYRGVKYILHHTMHIQERMKTKGGFRCMCVEYLPYNENEFPLKKATREGVSQLCSVNSYELHSGAEMCTCAEIGYEKTAVLGKLSAKSLASGSWIYIKDVDFIDGAQRINLTARGRGEIYFCLDEKDSASMATIKISSDYSTELSVEFAERIKGIHNIYFIFSDENICIENWQIV